MLMFRIMERHVVKKKKNIESLREVALKQFVISGDLEQEFEAMTVCLFSEVFPLQVYFCYKADFFFFLGNLQ